MKMTLITGGSGGLGKEFAKLFLKDNNDCLLVGSNKERLEKARRELGLKFNYEYIVLNDEIERAAEEIKGIIRSKMNSTITK